MARSTICTFSVVTAPSRCRAASCGSNGSNRSPSIDIRGPTAAAARTREAASPWESWNIRIKNLVRLEKQHSPARSAGFRVSDKVWSMSGSRFRKVSNSRHQLIFSAALS